METLGPYLDRDKVIEPILNNLQKGAIRSAARIANQLPGELIRVLIDKIEKQLVSKMEYTVIYKFYEAIAPSVQKYIAEKLNINMPVELPHGWTTKIKEMLKDITVDSYDEAKGKLEYFVKDKYDDYMFGNISWQRLKGLLSYVPVINVFERQNEAPMFLDFIEAAAKCPDTYFSAYIIGERRPDERLSIDGIFIPAECESQIIHLLRQAFSVFDEFSVININGKNYVYMWWD